MKGANPIRPPVMSDGHSLEVKEIFPTIQGEGPYAGWPAVFIRLGGCNLACDFCDTQFEDFTQMDMLAIQERVYQFSTHLGKRMSELVVITGGEPFRQNIAVLCEILLEADYIVQIETNGTLFRPIPYGVDIVCSPKVSNMQYHPLRQDLLERVTAFKFLIAAGRPEYFDVPDIGQEKFNVPVYIQPMDEEDEAKNRANVSRAIQLCMENGYRLSLQTHKILNIP